MTYFSELCTAMQTLAKHPRTIFMGQSVAYPGTAMFGTLDGIPLARRLELPVAEELQMGMAIGMSLNGDLPICLYPRFNFLLLAMGQLVLHLDKLSIYSNGGYKPRVIVRTAIATNKPMDPGPQHLGDYTDALRQMTETIEVVRLENEDDIVPQYEKAMTRDGSTVLVEMSEKYANG
jgi:pyruvate/2-oxoglutarate/acetoin dehydrogenase E1 component